MSMRSFKHSARRAAPPCVLAAFVGGLAGTLPAQALAQETPPQLAANSTGSVEGSVADADGQALAGIRVELADTSSGKLVARAQTDGKGRFSIGGVSPGSYRVSASRGADDVSSAEVQVRAGAAAAAALELGARELQTVTVTAQRFERARNQLSPATGSSQYTFGEKAIEQLPQGENTPFNQVLLQAPGVANDSYGQLHVRGDHGDLQYRLNGIILPDGVSGFGQVFDPRFAKSITLNDGALPAEYGLRTAGVVDIVTKDRLDEGEIDLYGGSHDTVNPSFQLGKTWGAFSAYVTGQYLSSNLGVENPTKDSTAVHDWTSQGKGFGYFSWLLGPHTKLSAILAATGSRLEIPNNPGQPVNCDFVNQLNGNSACDPGNPPTDASIGAAGISSRNLDERQYERNQFGILALQGALDDGLNYQIAAFNRVSTVQFTPDLLGDLAFNGDASRIKRKAAASGVQGDLSYPLGGAHTLSTGFSASTEDDRADNTSTVFTTATPSGGACPAGSTLSGDGSTCYGGPVSIVDNNPKNGNTLLSLYVQDKWDVTDSLVINYGLRFDKLNAYTSGSQLSPRIGMIDYLTPRTTLHAGYARYFTPPPNELVANASLAKFVGTTQEQPLQNDPVRPERSHYFDLGVVHQLTPELNIGLDSYYRYARNLIDEGQFGSALIFTPFNYDTGHVYGVEFSSNFHRGGFSGYFNAARSVAQGTNIVSGQFNFAADDLDYIRSHYIYLDHNQLWTLSGGAAYKWLGTTYGVQGTYGDGLRRDAPGIPNGGKLRPTVQVDLSATRDIHLGETLGDIGVRLAVLNILDRDNEIRDGTGIGVGAPQFGPRTSLYFGINKPFSL
jgi:outer membrane receptor protein involved in Fe transport